MTPSLCLQFALWGCDVCLDLPPAAGISAITYYERQDRRGTPARYQWPPELDAMLGEEIKARIRGALNLGDNAPFPCPEDVKAELTKKMGKQAREWRAATREPIAVRVRVCAAMRFA